MVKKHHIANIVPFASTIASTILLTRYFSPSPQYFIYAAITITGLCFWWAGKIFLGDAFSTVPRAKRLVTKGIYSKIRHPIYTGICLMLIGLAFLGDAPLSLRVLILFFAAVKIIRAYFEEKLLEKRFAAVYIEYKKNTWF